MSIDYPFSPFYVSMQLMQKIIVVCGPTATGKTSLAIQLAQQYGGEIISADSRQVYTGLDIGSAKVTTQEMQNIPHHLIDIANPDEIFSVADFQKLAKQTISEIHDRGDIPIICGGTGMYIDATIFETDFPSVPPNPELRSELEQKTTPELFEQLQQLDQDRSENIDSQNRSRIIRALEIATTLGQVPKTIQKKSNYQVLWIGLMLPKEQLQENIIKRINDRIPALFGEIKNLHASGVSFERLYSFGLEYRYGAEYVQGKISLDEFKEILTNKTWQFAKRQMTWFKRNPEIHWCNPISDKQKILQLVKDFKG